MKIVSVASAMPKFRYPQRAITAALERYWEGRLEKPELVARFHSRVGVDYRHSGIPAGALCAVLVLGRNKCRLVRGRPGAGGARYRSCIARGRSYSRRRQRAFRGLDNRRRQSLARCPADQSPGPAAGRQADADFRCRLCRRCAGAEPRRGLCPCVSRADCRAAGGRGLLVDDPARRSVDSGHHRQRIVWRRRRGGGRCRRREIDDTAGLRPSRTEDPGVEIGVLCRLPRTSWVGTYPSMASRSCSRQGLANSSRPTSHADVDEFLSEHRLRRSDIGTWVIHTGGPKVLDSDSEGARTAGSPSRSLMGVFAPLRQSLFAFRSSGA